ncbi:MAG: 50S ribosomal protein L17 [Candidatus Pacebacteria bacterium]|nr:50S ribosomal protein L17 [Candidatus Paceibacterota bacterium]MDD3808219.1 50S ribosomal protein L17 [Candidatus Paceibacterota bacterium]
MKHLNKKITLHRKRDQRRALIKVMANNLILFESTKTTPARAKATQRYVERLISRAKKQDLTAYRYILARLSKKATNKLYYEIAKNYMDRNGGFTRIVKLAERRLKDKSPLVIIQLVK